MRARIVITNFVRATTLIFNFHQKRPQENARTHRSNLNVFIIARHHGHAVAFLCQLSRCVHGTRNFCAKGRRCGGGAAAGPRPHTMLMCFRCIEDEHLMCVWAETAGELFGRSIACRKHAIVSRWAEQNRTGSGWCAVSVCVCVHRALLSKTQSAWSAPQSVNSKMYPNTQTADGESYTQCTHTAHSVGSDKV